MLLTKVEHHANIVPWQIIAREYGIIIDWVELHADGTIDYDSLEKKLPNATALSITGASNVTGEILDLDRVREIFESCGFGSSPSEKRELEGVTQKGIPNSVTHPNLPLSGKE